MYYISTSMAQQQVEKDNLQTWKHSRNFCKITRSVTKKRGCINHMCFSHNPTPVTISVTYFLSSRQYYNSPIMGPIACDFPESDGS
jgi:hypothetical protein